MANNENSWVNGDLCTFFELAQGQGPSKMDLMMAMMNHSESQTRVPSEPIRLNFTARKSPVHQQSVRSKFYARLTCLLHEDGSDDSYMLEGFINNRAKWDYQGTNLEHKFVGYYNTKTRTGWLKIENIEPEQVPQN